VSATRIKGGRRSGTRLEQAFEPNSSFSPEEIFPMSMEFPDKQDDFLSPDQLASALKLTPTFVGDLIRDNKIPYYRLGWRCVRVRLSDVLERTLVPAQKPMAPIPKKLGPRSLRHLKHVMAAEKKQRPQEEEAVSPGSKLDAEQ
jgi:excisionase family DNA binding protein